jgi:hypothetical protein
MGILRKVTDKFRPKMAGASTRLGSEEKSNDERHFFGWTRLDAAIKASPNPDVLIKAREQAEAAIAKETLDFSQRIAREAVAYEKRAEQAEKAARYAALEKSLQRRDKAAGKNQGRGQDIGR